jgi:enterochelin esterase-like enzyme
MFNVPIISVMSRSAHASAPTTPQLETRIRQLAEKQISPWIEGTQVTFLYQGTSHTREVELAGEITGWHSRGLYLQRLPGDLFYLSVILPRDARLEYKFLVNGEWTMDPWNQTKLENGIGGQNSAFGMPDYQGDVYPHWAPDIPHGQVVNEVFQGNAIPGQRGLHIYLPPNYDPDKAQNYPVIYAHDGNDYMHNGKLNWILDRLIAEEAIEPVIAVCIDPIHRFSEYTFNNGYCHLLVEEIVPYIDANYKTKPSAESRTLLGSSLGGLVSTYMAFQYSHVFGNVFGQSSSYQFYRERMVDTLRDFPTRPIRFYLSAGCLEGLIQANRHMADVLATQGYTFRYQEYNEGHNWTHWSHRMAAGLKYLFGKSVE